MSDIQNTEEIRNTKHPWTLLGLWFAAMAGLAFVLASWNNPSFNYWRKGSLGASTLETLGLLIGITVIVVLERSQSVSKLREIFCLQRFRTEYGIRWLFLGVAVGLLLCLKPSAWQSQSSVQQAIIHRAIGEGGLGYFFLFSLVISPFLEEAILRAYLYDAFQSRYSRPIAYALVGMLNIIFHYGEVRGSFFYAYWYAGLGILFCYVFSTRRNLMDSIACHVGYNVARAIIITKWVLSVSH